MTGSMHRSLTIRVVGKRKEMVKTSRIKPFRQIRLSIKIKQRRITLSKKTFLVHGKSEMRVKFFFTFLPYLETRQEFPLLAMVTDAKSSRKTH